MSILLSFILCCICAVMGSYEVAGKHGLIGLLYYLATLILFRIVWNGTSDKD